MLKIYLLIPILLVTSQAGAGLPPVSLATVGSTPSSTAGSCVGNKCTLQPADGTNPGLITAGTQIVGGNKTIKGAIDAPVLDLWYNAGQSDHVQRWSSNVGTALAFISTSGLFNGGGIKDNNATPAWQLLSNTYVVGGEMDLGSAFSILWSNSAAYSGTKDVGLIRTSAGKLKVTDASSGYGIISAADPASAQDLATKSYVDTQLLQLNPADAVSAASVATVPGTYANSVSGVCIGDTFTTTATTAFALDGTSPVVGARVLLKDQSSSFQDGVWTLTTQAVGGVSGAVLTRALDFDSSADINAGQIIPVISGTANAGSSWFQTATNTTCNTSAQTWTQFQKASSAYLVKASNLSDVASVPAAMRNLIPASTTISASAIDWSLGTTFTKSIGSTNTTFTFSNTQDGQTITVAITATTGTVSWPAISWQGGTAPAQVPNKTDLYTFIKVGSTIYGTAVQGF